MGRLPRPKKDVEKKKEEILQEALRIIEKKGFEGFSIRQLGPKVGVAPKTIYNYFHNKDEIYLHILTRGFELLVNDMTKAVYAIDDPSEQLAALAKAYVKFGLEESNYYDIMLTLYVPKANDYIGTPQEELSQKELATAMQASDLFRETIGRLINGKNKEGKKDSNLLFMQLLAGIHGIVALKNNTIFDYLHEDPSSTIDDLIDGVLEPFRNL